MNYEDKKIVGVLVTNVGVTWALNIIEHFAIVIIKYSDTDIMGKQINFSYGKLDKGSTKCREFY